MYMERKHSWEKDIYIEKTYIETKNKHRESIYIK